MAEIFPNEGLDLVLAVIPKAGTTPATTYMGLFTNFTASTVGTGGQGETAYTEVTNAGAYARQSIASASWGANANGGGSADQPGRKTTASQVTFPTATASWGTINGFHLSNSGTHDAGTLYFAANFDDTTAVTINTNDIIRVTPTWEIRN